MGKVVCFGEVLWDVLPTGKKVGGAPLNVALRLHSLGNEVYLISSVGNDANGVELMDEIKPYGIDLSYIQVENNLATSEVLVELDDTGSASYNIKFPCAWDGIICEDKDLALVESSDAFIFGSLGARNITSRETLLGLLDKARYKIFDVNLRAPYYSEDLLLVFMQKANFIKFNDEELVKICGFLGHRFVDLEESVRFIANKTNTKHICVTLGEKGALLFYDDIFYYNKGYKITVADTVGSGDSFLASLISKLMEKTNPQKAIDFACAVGAIVATYNGANPIISHNEIEKIMNA